MKWEDEGFLLSSRPHGESAAIIDVFTPEHGRHSGLVRGGSGRRLAPLLQPGAQLQLVWNARLEQHLGAFQIEPAGSRMPEALADRRALLALTSLCALIREFLPERQPCTGFYFRTLEFLALLRHPETIAEAYIRWELDFLREMGFGLDLSACAATGARQDLIYVSPRSGRAVSASAGAPWAPKLLNLPEFLTAGPPEGDPRPDHTAIAEAFTLTGFFLLRRLAASLDRDRLPPARDVLVRYFQGLSHIKVPEG